MFSGKLFRRRTIAAVAALVVLVGSAALIIRTRTSVDVTPVPFSDLLRDLDRGVVSEIVVNGDTLDVKLKALACHESQMRNIPYEEWVTRRAAELGGLAGVPYAEGFRTFDFTRDREPDEDDADDDGKRA